MFTVRTEKLFHGITLCIHFKKVNESLAEDILNATTKRQKSKTLFNFKNFNFISKPESKFNSQDFSDKKQKDYWTL